MSATLSLVKDVITLFGYNHSEFMIAWPRYKNNGMKSGPHVIYLKRVDLRRAARYCLVRDIRRVEEFNDEFNLARCVSMPNNVDYNIYYAGGANLVYYDWVRTTRISWNGSISRLQFEHAHTFPFLQSLVLDLFNPINCAVFEKMHNLKDLIITVWFQPLSQEELDQLLDPVTGDWLVFSGDRLKLNVMYHPWTVTESGGCGLPIRLYPRVKYAMYRDRHSWWRPILTKSACLVWDFNVE